MHDWFEFLASALLLIGGFFILIGALGMIKLPDFHTRLHAPTKATTLGIGCILIASLGLRVVQGLDVSIKELVISLFLFITAPVSAYMIAKAAFHRHTPLLPGTLNSHLQQNIRDRRPPSTETDTPPEPAPHSDRA
jgi:multicomponent K+:H+ antiporter subunit G